ncbi:MAG TPA: GNAT family N-acetyltransferase [Candidatus Polarisedimenticolaceae bacterium]|nr:GNAT family N-acetyltransferase [Candidatus Polarisedimenticolaceae bacterium]
MSSYRFCRTDDIQLLVDALNRCAPEGRATVDGFKRDIRELGVWCSSCMVAFDGPEPVGVLIGCKRPPETFVRMIAVHQEHRRKGHARHLLTSLSAKLAILGPPRLVAEVPEDDAAAQALFAACGWRETGRFADLVFDVSSSPAPPDGLIHDAGYEELKDTFAASDASSWERRPATLDARSQRLRGLVFTGVERVDASLVHDAGIVWAMSHERDVAGRTALRALAGELVLRNGGAIAPRVLLGDEVDEAPWIRPGAVTLRFVAEARGA